jgi:quinol monooxygenase YgiN
MYQILVSYHCQSKEDREGFYQELDKNRIQELCEEEKGCIRYRYYYPCNSETELFLLEQWETKEDQKVHTRQPHFALIGDLKKKYNAKVDFEIMNGEKLG